MVSSFTVLRFACVCLFKKLCFLVLPGKASELELYSFTLIDILKLDESSIDDYKVVSCAN